MALQVADAFIRLVVDEKELSKAVSSQTGPAATAANAAGKTVGDRFSGAFGTALTGVGAVAGIAFTSAVQAGTTFEDQLRTINTVAKLTDDQLSGVGKSILDLSRETGKTTDDLTAGFYDLVSAGIPADQAIKTLKSSAILATGALGTTGEAVDLVTSALGAYSLDAKDAGKVTDIFAQAVADGKTTVADLAGGISTIAPIAAAAGVSLEEVAAQTALMTLKGDTASQAMTRIRNAISALLTPNATLAEISKRVGINFADLAKDKGLAVALDELRKATNGNNEEFAKALGSSEALTLAFSVTGENAGAMATELGKVEGAANNGGVALGQYTEAQSSAAAGGRRLSAQIHAFLIEIGGPFVSTLGPALQTLTLLGPAFGRSGVAAKIFGGILGGLVGKGILPAVNALRALAEAGKLGSFFQDVSLGRSVLASLKGTRIGGKVAELIGVGIAKSTAIATGVGSALEAAPGSSIVKGAAAKGGAAIGGAYGKAVSLAMKLGIVLGIAEIADAIKEPVMKIAKDAHDAIFQGPLEGVGNFFEEVGRQTSRLPWPFGPSGAPDWAGGSGEAEAGGRSLGEHFGTGLSDGLAGGVAEGIGSVPAALRDASPAVRAGAEVVGADIRQPIADGAVKARTSVQEASSAILTAIRGLRDTLVGDASAAAAALYDPILKAQEAAETAAELHSVNQKLRSKKLTADEVAELTRRRTELGKQLLIQNGELLTFGTQAEQISKTKAFLASGFWSQAYRDASPEQRAALDQWKADLQSRLDTMETAAGQGGRDVRDGYIGPLKNGAGAAKGAADKLVGGSAGPMKDQAADARRWGSATAKAYGDGLESRYGYVQGAAQTIANAIANGLRASSPPVRTSPLHDIPKWGQRTIEAYADGLLEGTADVIAASASIAAEVERYLAAGSAMRGMAPMAAGVGGARGQSILSTPEYRAPWSAGRAAGAPAAAVTNNFNVELTGLVHARDPFEISTALERFQRVGVMEWPEAPK